MFLKNRIIKHDRNMDVCYNIIHSFDTGKKIKVKAYAVNMGYVESYYLNILLKFVIDKSDLDQWTQCSNIDVKCLRYSDWRKLK